MSHRLALALSIVLTLILSVGILAGRDRLFAADAVAGIPATTPAAVASGAGKSSTTNTNDSAAAPRVIEIPMPAAGQGEFARPGSDDERSARERDDDSHERTRYGDDDEGEHDD